MNDRLYQNYITILREELVPALGCTEPIALAYCAALARDAIGDMPEHMDVFCSGNIIKNTRSVTVPNSGGLRGIAPAAVLGAVGGNPHRKLEVLTDVTEEHRTATRALLEKDFCTCHLAEGVDNVYIRVEMTGNGHTSEAVIQNKHTNVIRIRKDDTVLYCGKETGFQSEEREEDIRRDLNVRDILQFANMVQIEEVGELLDREITMNTAISEEGLRNPYGAQVGRTLLSSYGDDVRTRARARAAAGSDARMNGCSLPVVINSGSGNQGITCSLPVVAYAEEWKSSREQLYRALVVSNLVAIHQKYYIGSLSAYCGAVSAACGAGAGIAYLAGGDYEQVSRTITNTLANISGVVCDGAKSSCAAKIASSVDAAIMGFTMEENESYFHPGDGLVQDDIEETIETIGYIGREGMKYTDVTILKKMIHEQT